MTCRTKQKFSATAIILVFALMLSTPALASGTEQSLRDRLTYSRAVESIIWSLPLMSYKAMRDGLKQDGEVGYNLVAYSSKVRDWRLQIEENDYATDEGKGTT